MENLKNLMETAASVIVEAFENGRFESSVEFRDGYEMYTVVIDGVKMNFAATPRYHYFSEFELMNETIGREERARIADKLKLAHQNDREARIAKLKAKIEELEGGAEC